MSTNYAEVTGEESRTAVVIIIIEGEGCFPCEQRIDWNYSQVRPRIWKDGQEGHFP